MFLYFYLSLMTIYGIQYMKPDCIEIVHSKTNFAKIMKLRQLEVQSSVTNNDFYQSNTVFMSFVRLLSITITFQIMNI